MCESPVDGVLDGVLLGTAAVSAVGVVDVVVTVVNNRK